MRKPFVTELPNLTCGEGRVSWSQPRLLSHVSGVSALPNLGIHNRRWQELCCFRTRHFEQPTNRPASFVTVDGITTTFARHLKAHLLIIVFRSTELQPAARLSF